MIDVTWIVILSQLQGQGLLESDACPTSVLHRGPFSGSSSDSDD